MARKTNKNAPQDNFWMQGVEELPRADIEFIDKSSKRMKFNRLFIYTTIGLMPVSLLANIAMLPKIMEEEPPPPAVAQTVSSPTKAVAMTAVEEWLAADPSPLPGGRLLSWDGAEVQAEPSITTNPDTGQSTEVQGLQLHTMTIVTTAGALYTTQVQVAYNEVRGAQVMGQPTLIPRAPDETSAWPNLNSWPNLEPATKSDELTQAVEAWVEAFTSGDPNVLRLAVGDTAANRSYVPLVHAKASDVQINMVASEPMDANADDGERPKTVVAQIEFSIKWDSQAVSRGQQLSTVTYDVLIHNADTAAPQVVAWGGVGTGEDLKPYMNAVEGRKITSAAIETGEEAAEPAEETKKESGK
ncbi:hypothetical protein [Arthrobacter sp. zg-Y1110]|uniref:hypothetical protein n=1 Tax=Arthrobacter sp. zg-Y1110 TaxID=2886932 RepID=UPI001D13DD77|nr:hypothetical protein [Arthrobacter sp. zg-Y1110]MCC3292848.1 hypothetical protein [Arthrobacter sp. zg-Y1110]UWX86787.1 hypothetical protein N2K99_18260 [Arthrobacter sp. zg-Y1110]